MRPKTINIPELRRILDELLTHVQHVAGPNVPIDSDCYWDLPSPELWDVSKGIDKVDQIGSLGDDLSFPAVDDQDRGRWPIPEPDSCCFCAEVPRREGWSLTNSMQPTPPKNSGAADTRPLCRKTGALGRNHEIR